MHMYAPVWEGGRAAGREGGPLGGSANARACKKNRRSRRATARACKTKSQVQTRDRSGLQKNRKSRSAIVTVACCQACFRVPCGALMFSGVAPTQKTHLQPAWNDRTWLWNNRTSSQAVCFETIT